MNTCETCVFWKPKSVISAGVAGKGDCFRYPPQVVAAGTPGGIQVMGVRPTTDKNEGCGEHLRPDAGKAMVEAIKKQIAAGE